MRRAYLLIAAFATLVFAKPAAADTVSDWWEFANRISSASQSAPGSARTPDGERALTRVTLAMFEALNAINRRYESYLGLPAGDPSASQDAAAATAAYRVLLHHFPTQKTTLDDAYALAMASVTDERAREAGRRIGEQAAAAVQTAGGIDSTVVQMPYRPRTTPGEWIGAALPSTQPYWAAFRPWAIPSPDALRPPPPVALNSERWARDYDEVRRLGSRNSTGRTPLQTLMARYRESPDLTPSLRMAADAPGRTPVQNARMFALFQMAVDDAAQAMIVAKLHYNFWRPITAIRNGAGDGNDTTSPDPLWVPLLVTPNFPEYPCGHCTYAAAIAEVMKAEVGPRPAGGVRVSSQSIPNAVVQVLPTWDEWVRQVSDSRIYGGVHYRFSNEAGEEIGRRAARMVLEKVMRPLPRRNARR
ncbi:MAG TPA: vanadium-dependent haloperoxidase [Longimicrobiaceae bacterium]|nr:vanadium-dependent haloperoxidase [Longimicrobiaceae bacterium]